MTLLVSDLVTATGGRLLSGDPRVPLGRIVIDSRAVAAGDVFFAIHGERLDGHTYVRDAIAAGAAVAVIHDLSSAPGAAAIVVQVDDTTAALQNFARYVRRQ